MEDIARWSQQVEGQYFERKSAFDRLSDGGRRQRNAKAVAKDVVETLAAMANADGGELVIGVEDDGAVTGVPHPDDKVALIVAASGSAGYVRPPLRVQYEAVRTDDGNLLLHFEVDWSPVAHQLADGRYLRRFRDQNRPWPAEDVTAIKQTERERQAEGGFVDRRLGLATFLDQVSPPMKRPRGEMTHLRRYRTAFHGASYRLHRRTMPPDSGAYWPFEPPHRHRPPGACV